MKLPNAAPNERSAPAAYRALEKVPLGIGQRLFSGAMRLVAPYFTTVPVIVESVESGRAEARMGTRPWTRNHLGTVHAIALCNMAEMTMGVVAEATVPSSQRWIPKGMTVSYDAKARGTMHAVATLDLPEKIGKGKEVPVQIAVIDDDDQTVFTAEIRIWVTTA